MNSDWIQLTVYLVIAIVIVAALVFDRQLSDLLSKKTPAMPKPWISVQDRLPSADDGELFVIWDWDNEYALARFTSIESSIWFQYEGAAPFMIDSPEYQNDPRNQIRFYDEVRYWMPVHDVPEMIEQE